jgi:hypothetical protein
MEVNSNGDTNFSGVAYTGKPFPSNVFDDKGNERRAIIDLETLDLGKSMPVLDDHGKKYQHIREAVIGLVDEIYVHDNQIIVGNATLFTGDNEAAKMIKSQSDKNVPYQMSVHWDDGELYDAEHGDVINGHQLMDGDIVIKNAALKETTVTLFGVDSDTSVDIN